MNARDLAKRKVASQHKSKIRAKSSMRRKGIAAADFLTPTTQFVEVDSEAITKLASQQVNKSKKLAKKKEKKRVRLVLRRHSLSRHVANLKSA
jgi:SOS response regulatory protein OraA/RecX